MQDRWVDKSQVCNVCTTHSFIYKSPKFLSTKIIVEDIVKWRLLKIVAMVFNDNFS